MIYIVSRPFKIESHYLLDECAGVYDDFHLAVTAARELYEKENPDYYKEEFENMEFFIDVYQNNSEEFERISLNDIKP